MMRVKDFRCAHYPVGIEIAHMILKELMPNDGGASTAAEQFYSPVM
jgi:putative transposase